ncbi:MAG: hypothetical protein C0602_00575 [Denitrovibrio sp.]|nr:MAG: hypothetical protein C0602_00575 [Denitrovibrio sp.]
MISSLRNKKKLTTFSLWLIIAAFVGTIFFVWGVGDKASEQLYAAKVDDIIITDQDFRQKVDDTREQFRQLFGNNIDEVLQGDTLEKNVMESLINEALLRIEAKRLSIPVSDAEVSASIQSMQAFQTDGFFDQERYVQLLARNRLIPQAFEESVRENLTYQKMQALINDSVAVSDLEIKKEYTYNNMQASIRFLEINSEDFVSNVEVTDTAVTAFYEEYKENYRVPEKADFKYAVFNPETFSENVEATESEIENYFIRNKESFIEPEQVNAAHILLTVDNWDDEKAATAVYQKAKDIKKQIENGADFAEMAKKFSEDGSAETGGDLGFFTKDQMVPEFEKAAFETEVGEISDVVKTQFGFHIIKVKEHKQESKPTLDEVKDEIANIIIEQKSN